MSKHFPESKFKQKWLAENKTLKLIKLSKFAYLFFLNKKDCRAVGHCPGGPRRRPLQQTSILPVPVGLLPLVGLLRRSGRLLGWWLLQPLRIGFRRLLRQPLLFRLQQAPTRQQLPPDRLPLPGVTRLPFGRLPRSLWISQVESVHPFRISSTGKTTTNLFISIQIEWFVSVTGAM